jgi:hypothetical protein
MRCSITQYSFAGCIRYVPAFKYASPSARAHCRPSPRIPHPGPTASLRQLAAVTMQVLSAQRRLGASSLASRRGAGARSSARPLAPRASSNGAAAGTRLADVDEYHQAWISAVDAKGAPAGAPVIGPDGNETFLTNSRDAYFTRRHELVLRQFPNALGVDDFISRVEIALSAHGFRGDNSIGAARMGADARARAARLPRATLGCAGVRRAGPRVRQGFAAPRRVARANGPAPVPPPRSPTIPASAAPRARPRCASRRARRTAQCVVESRRRRSSTPAPPPPPPQPPSHDQPLPR